MPSFKQAIDISPAGAISKSVAGSIGRLNFAPYALLLGQENAINHLRSADEVKHREAIDRMRKRFPKELADVGLRFEGSNITDDYRRLWNNNRITPVGKLLGGLTLPATTLSTVMSRGSHYNPFTNTATVYGDVDPITSHELGHAVDFNRVQGNQSDWRNRLTRDAYTFARMPEAAIGLNAGPVTQWMEIQANRNVDRALSGIKNKQKQRDTRAEAWRRLAPAYGTYAAAGAVGALSLVESKLLEQDTTVSKVFDTIHEKMRSRGWNQQDASRISNLAIGLGVVGIGALSGRAVAEIRNFVARRSETKEDAGEGKGKDKAKRTKLSATALRRLIKLVPQSSTRHPGRVSHNLMLGGKEIGGIRGDHLPSGFQVSNSYIDTRFQGMGLGKKMYGDLLKQLGGKPLLSDATVSPEAQRVWQSMAKRPSSYTVKTNPAAQIVPGATAMADPTTVRMANSAAAIKAKMSAPLWRRLLGMYKKPVPVPETQNNVFEAMFNRIGR